MGSSILVVFLSITACIHASQHPQDAYSCPPTHPHTSLPSIRPCLSPSPSPSPSLTLYLVLSCLVFPTAVLLRFSLAMLFARPSIAPTHTTSYCSVSYLSPIRPSVLFFLPSCSFCSFSQKDFPLPLGAFLLTCYSLNLTPLRRLSVKIHN